MKSVRDAACEGGAPARTQKERGAGIFWRGGIALRRTRKERQAPAHCPRPAGCGEARSSARSAHRNGHFPSSWKMSGTQRAVGRNRAAHFIQSWPSPCPGGAGGGEFGAGGPRRCPPPHAAFRTLCPQTGQSVRSEAHYAAAVPRLAQPASGGRSFKTGGERRPAFLSPPARRPGPLHGHL